MKIKLLDEIPFVVEKIKEGTDGKLYADNIPVNISIKNSKSFIIVKNNVIQYLEKHKMVDGYLIQNDGNPLKIYPFANFKIIKLTKDFYETHMFSEYKIKIDFAGLKNEWYFVDLNWWQKFRLDFYANYTIVNSANIHQLIYGVFGGLIGALILQLISGGTS